MEEVKITIDYNKETISIEGNNKPSVSITAPRRNTDRKKALLFMEVLLYFCYPQNDEKNFCFGNNWFKIPTITNEIFSNYRSEWNKAFKNKCDFLKSDNIRKMGTGIETHYRFTGSNGSFRINDYIITVSIVNADSFDRENALNILGINSIDWDKKNTENRNVKKENNSSTENSEVVPKFNIDQFNNYFWLDNQIMRELEGYEIDEKLLPKVNRGKKPKILSDYLWDNLNTNYDRVIAVEAGNGYGKSYSLVHSAKVINENKSILGAYAGVDRVVFIKAKDLNLTNCPLLSYVTKYYIVTALSTDDPKGIIKSLSDKAGREKIIFFIDGVDETNTEIEDQLYKEIEWLLDNTTNTYFIASNRSSKNIIQQLNKYKPLKVELGKLNYKELSLDEDIKRCIDRNKSFSTPLMISLLLEIKQYQKDSIKYKNYIGGYGNPGLIETIHTESQVFDAWRKLLISHSGDKRYLYEYIIPVIAKDMLFPCGNSAIKSNYLTTKGLMEGDSVTTELGKYGIVLDNESYNSLLRDVLNTGLIDVNSNGNLSFKNIRFAEYFAARYLLLLVSKGYLDKLKELIEMMKINYAKPETTIQEEQRMKALRVGEFVLRGMFESVTGDKEKFCKYKKALFSLSIHIGRDSSRDVSDVLPTLLTSVKEEFNNFDNHNDYPLMDDLILLNSSLYNTITKWKDQINNKSNESIIFARDELIWLFEYVKTIEAKGFEIDPLDFKENILSNVGAAEQELAKYYSSTSTELTKKHLNYAFKYHYEAFSNRKVLYVNSFNDAGENIRQSSLKGKTSIIRSIITIATDWYYAGLLLSGNDKEKMECFEKVIVGDDKAPGYQGALNLLGKYNYPQNKDEIFIRCDFLDREDCEPFVILRRIAGTYFQMYKITRKTNYLKAFADHIELAAGELLMESMRLGFDEFGIPKEVNYLNSKLWKHQREIDNFWRDIELDFSPVCVKMCKKYGLPVIKGGKETQDNNYKKQLLFSNIRDSFLNAFTNIATLHNKLHGYTDIVDDDGEIKYGF